jgi:hypothetical protein
MVLAKLAEKVLAKLGVLDRSGIDPADQENVLDAYKSVYAVLADDGLVTWALSDSLESTIPDRFVLSLTTLISAEIASFYGVGAPAEGWDRAKLNATNTIRRQLASAQPPETVDAEYY